MYTSTGKRRNTIRRLEIEGSFEEDEEVIPKHVEELYTQLYKEPCKWRWRLEGYNLTKLRRGEKD